MNAVERREASSDYSSGQKSDPVTPSAPAIKAGGGWRSAGGRVPEVAEKQDAETTKPADG